MKVGIVSVCRCPAETLSPLIKSTSQLHLVLAKREAVKRGWFEGILLNNRGELTEGTTTNLFWTKGKTLYTPSLDCGLLNGITRQWLIQQTRQKGWKIVEGRFRPKDWFRADSSFLTNSGWGIVPIGQINNRSIRLRQSFP